METASATREDNNNIKNQGNTWRITFKMSSPICFINRPLFDSLVIYCWRKEKYGNLPVKLDLSPEELSIFPGLPIDYHSDGYPLSSIMMFDESLEYEGSWKKRWCSKYDGLADFGKTKRKVHTGKGAFKSYDMPLPLYNISKVWFYFKGDVEEVTRLIDRHLAGIGKKVSQGYGFFDSHEIKSVADRVFDDILLRPIPVEIAHKYRYVKTCPHTTRYCGFRPTYHLPENQVKCIYPVF